MHPDLGDNERLLSPDMGGEAGQGESERDAAQGGGRTLHANQLGASGLVDFSQIYSGLARQVGDQHFAYMQVLVPSTCLIALLVPRAKTHFFFFNFFSSPMFLSSPQQAPQERIQENVIPPLPLIRDEIHTPLEESVTSPHSHPS